MNIAINIADYKSTDLKRKKTHCNGNCPCQNFRSKNSFKPDVALKHAPDERPVKKADQKSEIAPRERRQEEKT